MVENEDWVQPDGQLASNPWLQPQAFFSHSMSPPWETTSSQRSNSSVLGFTCCLTKVSRLASKHSFL